MDWAEAALRVTAEFGTPTYIFAWDPVAKALDELSALNGDVPVRHWFSVKTQPVPHLLRRWRDKGMPVEVVSECEFIAAARAGFLADAVLANGVAKHTWLEKITLPGLRVHFDSTREVDALARHAASCAWRVGLRYHPSQEVDPDQPMFGGQFGMTGDEFAQSYERLCGVGALVESVHFHLGSNVTDVERYGGALNEVAELCQAIGFSPLYVDCGGGLPVPGERLEALGGERAVVDLPALRTVLGRVSGLFPGIRELWLENGRFVTARSGVLAIRVLDIKERAESRYLICDGGRTNHALVSDWEEHDVEVLGTRTGAPRLTTICGPTCMAFDRLARAMLPEDVMVGDLLLWHNAGAYHVPWETRFSHGLAAIVWIDQNGSITLARHRETGADWWSQWV